MDKVIRTYLEWRFRVFNINKYQKYRDEWINALNDVQICYFEKEMNHLKNKGLYA